MLLFTTDVIYTGTESKVSKKGNPYQLVHMLDPQGVAFSCMLEEGSMVPPELKQLDHVSAKFKLTTGRFMGLSLSALNKK